MIYILSGDIRTGKTTALKKWIANWQNVKGILTPDNAVGVRELYHITEDKTYPFQAANENEATVSVGRFVFLQKTFDLANEILINEFEEDDFEFLVIDEIGKLELKGAGLNPAARHILQSNRKLEGDIILVVRSFLVEACIARYGIENYKVISAQELP
jgi:nucleoside-triphosphatase